MTYPAQKETLTWRKLHGFKSILAWQRGDDLAALIHGATKFGAGNYRLVDQTLEPFRPFRDLWTNTWTVSLLTL